jgi:quinolinate synthase
MIRHGTERAGQGRRYIVATETGILHRLRKDDPSADYVAANPEAVCQYMKTITPAKLIRSLQEGIFRVTVPTDVAERARRAIQRMVEIG